jgi:hypothetical protein
MRETMVLAWVCSMVIVNGAGAVAGPSKIPKGMPVPGPLPRGTVTVTAEVSANSPEVAMTRKVPALVPAVNNPAVVMVPPVAVNTTSTATLSPAVVRPKAVNCRVADGARVAVPGFSVTDPSAGGGGGGGGAGGSDGAGAGGSDGAGGRAGTSITTVAVSDTVSRVSVAITWYVPAESPAT